VTFENVQAGERTSHLFRLANLYGGRVVGTSDLSELALGYTTYGVGDHMAHYSVNASVPKTLIQELIRWTAHADERSAPTRDVLAILATTISPELVPGSGEAPAQSAEAEIGPYPLGGSLSPRSEWRAPSDASAEAWVDELRRGFHDAHVSCRQRVAGGPVPENREAPPMTGRQGLPNRDDHGSPATPTR
jgi:NH3-dependent NAD+ synthetase